MSSPSDNDRLLARWASNDLSEAEAAGLPDREELADYARLLAATDRLRPPAYSAADALAELKKQRAQRTAVRTLRPRPRRTGWAVAATIALLLSAWFFWPEREYAFVADRGNTVTAPLPDGSNVRLNAASALAYRATAAERTARLEGEAYFEVVPDDVPFVVRTPRGTVTVVGTSFNVYQRGEELRVSCETGAVDVRLPGHAPVVSLTPGRSVALAADGRVTEGATDAAETLDWLAGKTVFSARPLREVIAALERQFDLRVAVAPGVDLGQRVRTNFPNDDAAVALELVFGAFPELTYTLSGQQVNLRQKE